MRFLRCFAKATTLSEWINHYSLKAGLVEVIIRFFSPHREWINKTICCYQNQLILGVGIVGDTHCEISQTWRASPLSRLLPSIRDLTRKPSSSRQSNGPRMTPKEVVLLSENELTWSPALRTPAYYRHPFIANSFVCIFSLKSTRLIRTPVNTDNSHFYVSLDTNSLISSTPLFPLYWSP